MTDFYRDSCRESLCSLLGNGSISYNDPIFFRQNGIPMSNCSNIELTISGCQARCGPNNGWYPDIGPRLTTWIVPIIIIIGNMSLLYLGFKNWIFAVVHLVGDPVDALWSLLTNLEGTNRCWDLAEQLSSVGGQIREHVRDRGTILVAIYEVEGILRNPGDKYQEIVDVTYLNDKGREEIHRLLRRVANELSDSINGGAVRAFLAVAGYAYAVIGAFNEAIGGKSTSQPGRRIGIAMFLSWLLPIVLLTNFTAVFSSRRTALRILERFARDCANIQAASEYHKEFVLDTEQENDDMKDLPNNLTVPASASVTSSLAPKTTRSRQIPAPYDLQLFSDDRTSEALQGRFNSTALFQDAQPWQGAISVYQPNKHLFSTAPNTVNLRPLLTMELGCWTRFWIALLPFLVAETHSFLLIWVTPTTGLTCTHLALFGILGVWILSALFTHVLWITRVARGKYHWYTVLIKDALIAIPSFIMIILISCGYFNSCICWSSYFSRGWAKGYVMLAPDSVRKYDAGHVYLGLVISCLCMQFLVFGLILLLTRRGRSLCARSEKQKGRDFWEFHRAGPSSAVDIVPEQQEKLLPNK